MGLDQNAWIKTPNGEKKDFYWRKHARLQEWMTNLYYEEMHGDKPQDWQDFNCVDLPLKKIHIVQLHNDIMYRRLPHNDGGFFNGWQFQEEQQEEYRTQDLEFCEEALAAFEAHGDDVLVYYNQWF